MRGPRSSSGCRTAPSTQAVPARAPSDRPLEADAWGRNPKLPEVGRRAAVPAQTTASVFSQTIRSISGTLLGPTFSTSACLAISHPTAPASALPGLRLFSSNSLAGNGPFLRRPRRLGVWKGLFGRHLLQDEGVFPFHARLHILMGAFVERLLLRSRKLCPPLPAPTCPSRLRLRCMSNN